MTFASPSAFWALAALLLLLLFSLWRPRPRKVVVGSVRLWEKIPRRAPPLRAARRPRFSFVLILQALAILAMVGGLAGPSVALRAAPSRHIAIVLDTSGRMLARRSDGRTVFEAGCAMARKASEGHRVTLYWIDDAPRTAEGWRDVRPVHEHVDIAPLIANAKADEVWVVSDRPQGSGRQFLAGEPTDNTGIAHVLVSGNELFVRLQRGMLSSLYDIDGSGAGPSKHPISISIDGKVAVRAEIRGNIWWGSLALASAKTVTVALLDEDRLAIDDRATLMRFDPDDGMRLIGEHPLLARALQSAGARLGRGRTAVLYRTVTGEGETLVYVDPPSSPPGFALGESFTPKSWSLASHPLVRDVRPEHLSAAGAREVTGGEPLLFADGRCVAAVQGRKIVLGFELTREGWTSTPSFPVFWTNVIDFARTGSTWQVLRTGTVFRTPPGTREIEPGARDALFRFDAEQQELITHAVGIYRADAVELEASVLDPRVSDADGIERIDAPPAAPASTGRAPVGAHFCLAALALVLLSWWLDFRLRG